MMLSRLVKASVALLLLLVTVPPPAQAQVRPPYVPIPLYMARFPSAVSFDGRTVLSYNGTLFGQPPYSNFFFDSTWIKSPLSNQGLFLWSWGVDDSGTGYTAIMVGYEKRGNATDLTVYFQWPNAFRTGGLGYAFLVALDPLPTDDQWHNLEVYIDTSGGQITGSYKVLGHGANYSGPFIPDPTVVNPVEGAPGPFDWDHTVTWTIGDEANRLFYSGDMAERYIDLSGRTTTDDSDLFIVGDKAPGLAVNCTRPTANIPQACFRGNAAFFPLAGPNIGQIQYNTFELNNNGTLRTAPSDPCVANFYGRGCAPANTK